MRSLIAIVALLAQCASFVAALPNFEHHHHNALARRITQNDAPVVSARSEASDEPIASSLEARGEWLISDANIRWWNAAKFQQPSCRGTWPSDNTQACIVSANSIPCGAKLHLHVNGKSTSCVVIHRRHGWSEKRIRVTKSVFLRLTSKATDDKLHGVQVKVEQPEVRNCKHHGRVEKANCKKSDDDKKECDNMKNVDDKKKGQDKKKNDDKKKAEDKKDDDKKKDEERKKKEDEKKRKEDEKKRKEDEKKRKEDEKKRKEDEKKRKEDEKKRKEDEKKKDDDKKKADEKKKAENNHKGSNGGGQVFGGAQATFFEQGGNAGNCGTVHKDTDYIVALQTSMYAGGSHCGQKVRITRKDNGKQVEAIVADSCPSCVSSTSLDLSVGAFGAIATKEEGMVAITWTWA